MMFRAPIAVIGEVQNVEEVGSPVRAKAQPEVRLQLHSIQVKIESVLKGVVEAKSINILYYSYSPSNTRTLGVETVDAVPGRRAIFFVARWGKGYRTAGDVTGWWLPLRSRHRPSACRGASLRCCIPTLLLTIGKDADVRGFLWDLPANAVISATSCRPSVARDLVTRLLYQPDVDIQRAARDTLMSINQLWP